jgi:hypothetical protein
MLKRTCGPLYNEGMLAYCKNVEEERLFAAGFVSGQAEKVYLGACRAAMFRPSPEKRDMLIEVVVEVAKRYDLAVDYLLDEIWILRRTREDQWALFSRLQDEEVNSPIWHTWRAYLCGVPAEEVDLDFHKRKGFGEKCDVREEGL